MFGVFVPFPPFVIYPIHIFPTRSIYSSPLLLSKGIHFLSTIGTRRSDGRDTTMSFFDPTSNSNWHEQDYDRWLAGEQDAAYSSYTKKEEAPLDYSVLSVGVMTLGLILCVEVIRHKLDHEAEHRPFFKVVLEATYSELATLGLVELFVFLLMRYYELKNKERKEVFAEVHFALFYTAIFNAFQSIMCALATRRASDRLWVQTEHLELDHYVEIREEFDRVSFAYHSQRMNMDHLGKRPRRTLSLWLRNAQSAIRNPGLRSRYLELLVQVRFHQLRIQFLENNNLPLTLKVSDYLKRSEEAVLMHMVHVSGTAWLLLTGAFNLIYFLLGIVANQTGDMEIIGTALAVIFFSVLILFIVICIVLYMKMRSIFEDILEMKHIQETDREAGAQRQRNLFWFNEPQLVISLIQVMQFGYAIALAIVIMFWQDLGQVAPYYYLIANGICYAIFIYVLAKVLPQFTLCTSLGHLVNKERLNETLALHRFHEAQRRQKRKMVQLTFGENLDDSIVCMQATDDDNKMRAVVVEMDTISGGKQMMMMIPQESGGLPSTAQTLSSGSSSSEQGVVPGGFLQEGNNSAPLLLLPRASSAENMHSRGSLPSDDSFIRPSTPKEKSMLLADLVKMDTSQLRQQLPESDQNRIMQREKRMMSRRANRKKAVSEGVQAMRGLGQQPPPDMSKSSEIFGNNTTELSTRVEPPTNKSMVTSGAVDDAEQARLDRAARLANRRANRKKAMTASSVIQSWRTLEDGDNKNKAPKKPTLAQISENARHERKKSSSNPDVIQSWQRRPQETTDDGVNFVLKHPISQNTKTTDDPAVLHRQLRAERLNQQRESRRKSKSLSASAVIQSWQDFSIADPPAPAPKEEEHDSFFIGVDAPTDDDHETTPNHQGGAQAPGSSDVAVDDDNVLENRDDSVMMVVNLADASLVPTAKEEAPRTKKSVGFSSMDDSHSDGGSSLLQKPGTDNADDDSTVDTGKSVGELSDVGGVTQHFDSIRSSYQWEEPWYVKLQQRLSPATIKKFLHGYFVTGSHAVFSHVFGSIVVFFLIGMRLETFNAVTNLYNPSLNTWELRLNVAFWWQATWYMLFIVVSGLAVWAVHPSECKSIPEKRAFVAAAMDIFLSILCMTLLFVADAQRCCDDETSYEVDGYVRRLLRFLEKGEDEDLYGDNTTDPYGEASLYAADSYGSDYEAGIYDDDIYTQCCPAWGYRTYGGYGNIEPFTALIGLRVIRFYLAKYLVRAWLKKGAEKEAASQSSTDQEHSADDHHDHGHGGGHGHGHGGHETGTPLELWQRAISKYPEVVEKYGQFSSELFQAMLGLEIIEEDHHAKSVVSIKDTMTPTTSTGALQALDEEDKQDKSNNPHYKLNGEQYSSLSAECQGFILAGKLGKPVKSMANMLEHSTSVGDLPTLHEESATEGGDHTSSVKSANAKGLEFEVDDQLLAEEEEADSEFIAPNARLIRSMRRCERRLYPLLKEWTPVDVVMTNYEIVYFEVENDSEENLEPELRRKKVALHIALQATKGGKGLRLMDVAAGRKVVGHLDLTDITQVHVERQMPLLDVSHLEREEESIDVGNQPASEYWLKPSHIEVHDHSRNLRWAKEKEDRLKLVSIHGTLLLRFYSDLNDAESHHEALEAEDELFGALKKDISFQWAQTLAHICGTEQLKQPLPHFGANDSEELRDYLEVVNQKAADMKHHRRSSSIFLGNHGSTTNSQHRTQHDLATIAVADPQVPKPKLRPSKSFGDGHLEKTQSFRIFRRSASSGEQDSKRPRAQSADVDFLADIEIGNEKKADASTGDEEGAAHA